MSFTTKLNMKKVVSKKKNIDDSILPQKKYYWNNTGLHQDKQDKLATMLGKHLFDYFFFLF